MQYYDPKSGTDSPRLEYDDGLYSAPRGRRESGIRQAQTTMPWWNPRYWRKRVWIGLSIIVLVVIIIAVAVGITQSKDHPYPDYSALNYFLKETCWSRPANSSGSWY